MPISSCTVVIKLFLCYRLDNMDTFDKDDDDYLSVLRVDAC